MSNTPCPCCEHYEDGDGDMQCLDCKHNGSDNFKPSGKCATCAYDPRLHGICMRCVDGDKHKKDGAK